MNRFAFTLSVPPEAAAPVAGILAYYLPGVTLARNDRVVHVVDTDDDLGALAARLSHRPRGASIVRALAGYWQPPPSSYGEPFLAATVMETNTHYEGTNRTSLAPDAVVARYAYLLPARARVPVGPPGDDDPGRTLLSRTVFCHRDVVVCFRETTGHGSEPPPEPSTHHAMTLLSATHHWAGGDDAGPAESPRPMGGRAHAGTHR